MPIATLTSAAQDVNVANVANGANDNDRILDVGDVFMQPSPDAQMKSVRDCADAAAPYIRRRLSSVFPTPSRTAPAGDIRPDRGAFVNGSVDGSSTAHRGGHF